MPALVIAIGNPLRRDDGAAHSVRIRPGIESRSVLQLAPEIAEEIARYNPVLFIDADVSAKRVRIHPVDSASAAPPLTHVSSPGEIVALARELFGFSGCVYTCHIPASDFSAGIGLSPRAKRFVRQAALEIDNLLAGTIK
jgi:Ni,Fe-hydrogenase maturation factor